MPGPVNLNFIATIMLKIHGILYLDGNFFLRFYKMGCSRKYQYPPWRKLTIPPSLLRTSCTNSIHSLYDSPLPL